MEKLEFIQHCIDNHGFEPFYDEENEFILEEHQVRIEINADNSFNIFKEFTYSHGDEVDFTIEQAAIETIYKEQLNKGLKAEVTSKMEFGYGCPYEASQIGCFNEVFDMVIIDDFINCCNDLESDLDNFALNHALLKNISECLDDSFFINSDSLQLVGLNCRIETSYVEELAALNAVDLTFRSIYDGVRVVALKFDELNDHIIISKKTWSSVVNIINDYKIDIEDVSFVYSNDTNVLKLIIHQICISLNVNDKMIKQVALMQNMFI